MANTTFRFIRGASQDNTARTITQDMRSVTYASTLAFVPIAQQNLIQVTQLTGAVTVTIDTTQGYVGDTCRLIFAADGTNRTVTFSTGFAVSASTLVVVASKYGSIDLVWNGVAWQETTRALTA